MYTALLGGSTASLHGHKTFDRARGPRGPRAPRLEALARSRGLDRSPGLRLRRMGVRAGGAGTRAAGRCVRRQSGATDHVRPRHGRRGQDVTLLHRHFCSYKTERTCCALSVVLAICIYRGRPSASRHLYMRTADGYSAIVEGGGGGKFESKEKFPDGCGLDRAHFVILGSRLSFFKFDAGSF